MKKLTPLKGGNEMVKKIVKKKEATTIRFKHFTIMTNYPDNFIEEINKLCDKFEVPEGTFFDFIVE